MPFGPFDSFADCVAKSGDKGNPEAFCAWLHHELLGTWPSEAAKFPPERLSILDNTMSGVLSAFKFQALETRSVRGIEVFSVGTWTDSSGTAREWTADQLKAMAAALQPGAVALKVGHTSPDFNRKVAAALGVPMELLTGDHSGKGQVALGFASALHVKDGKLIADFDGVPAPLADLITGGQYCSVSSEIELTADGKAFLSAVALLGVEQPAVENLAGLEAAKVFTARDNARVYTFQKGGNVGNLTKTSPLADILAMFQEGNGDALTAIATMMGLDPKSATLADILAKCKEMMAGQGGKMPEGMAAEHSKLKADFSTLQKTVETQAATIATFEHERRVVKYSRMAEAWKGVAGKPEEIGAQLAETEEKAGEKVAAMVVAQFQAANKVAEDAGILKAIGRAKVGDGAGKDPFEIKVAEYAKTKSISYEKALVAVSEEDKEGWLEFRARTRSNGKGE